MNERFNFRDTSNPLEDFTRSLLEKARRNTVPMTGMDADQQADYILGRFRRADLFFVVYPSSQGCLGFEVSIIKGEAEAVAVGIALGPSDGASPLDIPRVKPRRGLKTDALFVPGSKEAQMVAMAYSARPEAEAWRQAQIDEGGLQALRNVRTYCTPYGFTALPLEDEA